jgi:RNA polymerase sigma factor (sigma-70 family)
MKQQIDTHLIESACQGDIDAIEALLHQCQPSLTCFARKYCATAEDVEDAVQQTLWVVYRKIETLRTSKAFVSWVFQIVRHYCYRLLSPKWQTDSIDFSKVAYLDYTEDPELYSALKHDVVMAISHLPSSYREVIVMRDIEGFTAPEVAEYLGLTLATVKTRLHRGRNLLREKLSHWAE